MYVVSVVPFGVVLSKLLKLLELALIWLKDIKARVHFKLLNCAYFNRMYLYTWLPMYHEYSQTQIFTKSLSLSNAF